jgi:uncharacterized protein YkwD
MGSSRAASPRCLPTLRSHVGVATRALPGGFVAAIALSAREIEVEPFARSAAPGATLALKGRVGARFERSRIVVTSPRGATSDRATGVGFDVSLPLAERGVHQVEVLGDGPTGPVVLLNVPVYVGVAEPERFDESQRRSKDKSSEAAKRELVQLTNALRSAASLGAVELDEELSRVAQAHSDDMRAHSFMGHVSPTTGDVSARLKAAAVPVGEAGENVAFVTSAAEAHRGFVGSPGHRAVLLGDRYTHVGIGVTPDGNGSIYVTEVFARRFAPIELATAPATLLETLNAVRASNGLKPLVANARLASDAAAAADKGHGADPPEPVAMGAASKGRSRWPAALAARNGCVWAARVRELDELTKLPLAVDPGAEQVGFGVAAFGDGEGPSHEVLVVVSAIARKGAGLDCRGR